MSCKLHGLRLPPLLTTMVDWQWLPDSPSTQCNIDSNTTRLPRRAIPLLQPPALCTPAITGAQQQRNCSQQQQRQHLYQQTAMAKIKDVGHQQLKHDGLLPEQTSHSL